MTRGFATELAAAAVYIALLCYSVTRIRYQVDDRHVRVVWLGFTVRRIALSDIEDVDTKSSYWNEHWCNTFRLWGRTVRIRRRTGVFRDFIITPENRDIFIADLKAKIGKTAG